MLAGVVLFPTAEYVRHAASVVCAEQLELPGGWEKRWIHGGNLANNLNRGIRENPAQWYWVMGDDHVYHPNTLKRLLAHGCEIIAPVCLMRRFPFCPVMAEEVDAPSHGKIIRLSLGDLPKRGGLWEVERVGGGGLLIHRNVLDALGEPWFEIGQIESDGMGEDIWFCEKARAKGFHIFVDLDAVIGHQAPAWVIPTRRPDGEWQIEVNVDNFKLYATTVTVAHDGTTRHISARAVQAPSAFVEVGDA